MKDKAIKALVLALDPRTPPTEAQSAWIGAFTILRKHHISYEELTGHERRIETDESYVIPFGPLKGQGLVSTLKQPNGKKWVLEMLDGKLCMLRPLVETLLAQMR